MSLTVGEGEKDAVEGPGARPSRPLLAPEGVRTGCGKSSGPSPALPCTQRQGKFRRRHKRRMQGWPGGGLAAVGEQAGRGGGAGHRWGGGGGIMSGRGA